MSTAASTSTSIAGTVRGFTLVELLIAVAIVGILVAVAYPSYEEQVRKTRRAEGKAALNEVASRLERCYTRFNAYDHATCAGIASMTSENGYYQISASAIAASSYTLEAAPRKAQVDDTKCGTLSLTHIGVRSHSGTPPTGYACW
ncbi:MAG TPA: type IV pilin protein [Lysobacter sp.]